MNKALNTLRTEFSGEIIQPGDALYPEVQNTLFARGAPALILRPRTADDVAVAINYARHQGLLLSIRSGGHSAAGFSTNDGGAVIDMSLINQVEVIDKKKQVVRLGSGAKWGDVAKELQKHGLALSSGDTVSVGVGGLTLCGGIGWMVRKHGLALDSLVGVEIVTADGKILRLNEKENPDLFWAIRGGGGNFGVITHFDFKAYPVDKVYSGTITYALENLFGLLSGLRDYMRKADENLTTILNILPSFGDNPPAALLTCCYASDDKDAATKAIEPLKHLGKMLSQDIKKKHYYEVLDEAHPPGDVKIIVNNAFVPDFSDELIAAIITAQKASNGTMILQIRNLGGAMSRVSANATAFHARNSEVLLISPTFVSPTTTKSEERKALKPWQSLLPFASGAYPNFFGTKTGKEVSICYPTPTYDRLAKTKKTYDPQNIFSQNYNINPA